MNIDDKKTVLEIDQQHFEQIDTEEEKSIGKGWLISLFAFSATSYLSSFPYWIQTIPDEFDLLALFVSMYILLIISSLTVLLFCL